MRVHWCDRKSSPFWAPKLTLARSYSTWRDMHTKYGTFFKNQGYIAFLWFWLSFALICVEFVFDSSFNQQKTSEISPSICDLLVRNFRSHCRCFVLEEVHSVTKGKKRAPVPNTKGSSFASKRSQNASNSLFGELRLRCVTLEHILVCWQVSYSTTQVGT